MLALKGRYDQKYYLGGGTYHYRHLSNSNSTLLRRRGSEYLFHPGKSNERSLQPQDRIVIGDAGQVHTSPGTSGRRGRSSGRTGGLFPSGR